MRSTIYNITTPRLMIRCYHLNDAQKLNDTIVASLDHLRPFMPWARGDQWVVEDRMEHIRHWILDFENNNDYIFGIFTRDGKTLLGGTGLHKRVGEGAFEIGYWIGNEFKNQGYITETVCGLLKVGFDHYQADRIEIHCSSLNKASARIPQKLGFEHEATLKRRYLSPNGYADRHIFTIFSENYPNPNIPELDIRAYDDEGRQYF